MIEAKGQARWTMRRSGRSVAECLGHEVGRAGLQIAILGWGSLLWDVRPEFDRWHEPWTHDGPTLNVEFSRVSSTRGGALTLVVDELHGTPIIVARCLSRRTTLDDAARDLRAREGTTMQNIGRLDIRTYKPDGSSMEGAIAAWARHRQVDAVVWTDLKSNFAEKVGRPLTIEAAVLYIRNLPTEGRAKAAEYVSRAPSYVDTPIRRALLEELGAH